MAGETAPERLARLLALIAYLRERPGVPVDDVAAHFGVTPAQVLADVNLLWVSGTPGYLPDDLIDFSYDAFEQGLLTLTDSRGMHRPLRLATTEAVALLAALRALEAMPGLPEPGLVASAVAKLSAAAGEAATAADAVDVRLARPAQSELVDVLRAAVTGGRVVHLRYVSAADVVSERDVDPLELLTDGARWFLRAWCHRAGEVRHFRLDRILGVRVTDHEAARHPDLDLLVPDPTPALSSGDLLATIDLAPRARWFAESLPVEQVEDLDDGGVRVRLRVASQAWAVGVLLALAPDVRAVEPPELAAAVARSAAAALSADDGLA
jgi:proteasome accessory factor C